ncbi:MAG: arabinogalactan endo-1,4-beta-galactosidase [Clostridiales bacterium]|nr:arabinogalactan endo-1,4-beta-galactosidase [Clostridiales bacterium]
MKKDLALGVDLGWASQLEDEGYIWVDDDGDQVDPIRACKDMGANAVRLRVFVNPPKEACWMKHENERVMLGYCDIDSVVAMAKRVKALDMDIMLDVHYSDHFSDPIVQDIPEAWKDDDEDTLTEKVYGFTKEIMLAFKENGLFPRWTQVGNEINNGIMWPAGALKENPEALVRFLNAGYDAVKEIFPDSLVITHMAMINNEDWCVPFLDNFFAGGGKTDIIGFSYYPYWAGIKSDEAGLSGWLNMYEKKYGFPVMIVEVGAEDEKEDVGYETVTHCINAILSVPGDRGLGVFYWEPDAHRSAVPDHYPLGAAVPAGEKRLRFTRALTAYK